MRRQHRLRVALVSFLAVMVVASLLAPLITQTTTPTPIAPAVTVPAGSPDQGGNQQTTPQETTTQTAQVTTADPDSESAAEQPPTGSTTQPAGGQ